MTFDLASARKAADTGGPMNTTKWLHAALDEIGRLQSDIERLVKMFEENTYIEQANMAPGYYNINLRGQGAMLLIGHLIQMFRDTGGENFVTNTLQMTLPDGKTNELFELTIQKVNGKDSPAMKIGRLEGWLVEAQARGDFLQSLVPVDWESCSEGHKNIWRLGARQQLLDRATEVGNCAP